MAEKKKLTVKDLQQEIAILDNITNALNTAIVALYKIVDVKGDELDKVTAEDYVKYVQEHVHPIVRRADELSREVAEKAAKSAKEAVEEK